MANRYTKTPLRKVPVVVRLTAAEHERCLLEVARRKAAKLPRDQCAVTAVLRDMGVPREKT